MRTQPLPLDRAGLSPARSRPSRLGIWVGLAAAALFWLARLVPQFTWEVYGRRVYPVLAAILSSATGWIPFSLGDLIIVGFLVACVLVSARSVIASRRQGSSRRHAARHGALSVLALSGWVWTYSVGAYALNYARPGPEAFFPLQDRVSDERVEEIVEQIGQRLDHLRAAVPERPDGVARSPTDLRELDRHLTDVQASLLKEAGVPAVTTGRTKWMLTSPVTGRYATGMYMFHTGEPTVVRPPYPVLLASTAAHERAHLSGLAGEDEASFVGVLTTWRSDRPEVRYAGWLDLWLTMGRPTQDRHPGVLRDHRAIWEHHVARTGFEAPVVRRAHDAALRAVGERQGVGAYGRVGELALRYIARNGMPQEPVVPPDLR